jgi:hypothetical protein
MGSVDKGREKEELIVLLYTIKVMKSRKQTKGDPGFTVDVTCLESSLTGQPVGAETQDLVCYFDI